RSCAGSSPMPSSRASTWRRSGRRPPSAARRRASASPPSRPRPGAGRSPRRSSARHASPPAVRRLRPPGRDRPHRRRHPLRPPPTPRSPESPMAEFTAKDVQALRRATGAGMMDAKAALQEAGGDFDEARKILREKGLAKAGSRADRENVQGAVAIGSADSTVALVELKSETDFVAKSPDFLEVAQQLADLAASSGEEAMRAHTGPIDDLRVTLKENIELGRSHVVQVEAGQVVDTYLHRQDGRGVNGVVVVLDGGSKELAHDIAIHIAFAKPEFLTREQV